MDHLVRNVKIIESRLSVPNAPAQNPVTTAATNPSVDPPCTQEVSHRLAV
ncbi:uncharacterized protein METZ01_LOCUS276121, partial [marine metagenome]